VAQAFDIFGILGPVYRPMPVPSVESPRLRDAEAWLSDRRALASDAVAVRGDLHRALNAMDLAHG
jgi:hypothetical protein